MELNLVDDRHKFIYNYWLEKKADRKAPARSDIDPLDFAKILPNVFMYDVYHDPLDYRLRLLGTRMVDVLGEDFTGRMFKDIFMGDEKDEIRSQYDLVVNSFKPTQTDVEASWINREHVTYSRLLMPLSSDNTRVNMLFGVTLFTVGK